MPLLVAFRGRLAMSTLSYETPAATEGHPLRQMNCVWRAFQPRRYPRQPRRTWGWA